MHFHDMIFLLGVTIEPFISTDLDVHPERHINRIKVRNRRRTFLSILCIIYFVMIFIITIFEREPGSRTGISLTLFETLGGPHDNAYVIEKILLFIPFGFLVPKMWKCLRRIPVCVFAGFCLSLTIEITQLLTQRGHFQVDDILMNTIGAGVGALFGLFRFRKSNEYG